MGEAGCGKSHLVADLATERIAEDLPSFLLLGQHLDTGVVDPQLVQMMGFGTMTLGDALQALDVAARIRRNGRALLVVDAVNEGAGADLWESQLPGFVAEVARYPWVALVVTLRDVYESSVVPGGTPEGMTRAVHRGLAGHEEEALNLYAELYGLRLPDVPTLVPEITNPLFLRSLCKSVQGRGLKEIPREAGSLVWVFDGLIEAVDGTLQRPARLNYADWERKVHKAVAALAAAMVDSGSEALPIADANDVCIAIHSHTENSKSLLNGLIVEGLLLRETIDRDGTTTHSIRFTYQRLSDHLRAEVLLDRNPTNTELAAAVRGISKMPRPWPMRGVVSALVLLVPETRGKELAAVLRFGNKIVGSRWAHQEPGAWLRGVAQEGFFETLMWRSTDAFTASTHDLLKKYLKAGVIDKLRVAAHHLEPCVRAKPSAQRRVATPDPLADEPSGTRRGMVPTAPSGLLRRREPGQPNRRLVLGEPRRIRRRRTTSQRVCRLAVHEPEPTPARHCDQGPRFRHHTPPAGPHRPGPAGSRPSTTRT